MPCSECKEREIFAVDLCLACLRSSIKRGWLRKCKVDMCFAEKLVMGYCTAHYGRVRKHGHPQADIPIKRNSVGHVNKDGYRMISRNSKSIAEHRFVMQEMLGRDLLPGENVHHKNGVRNDNRPENLELWIISQPVGQRPEDLLVWADEIIERYRGHPTLP